MIDLQPDQPFTKDTMIYVTPQGHALADEARRRVTAGESPDFETALGQCLRDFVMGRLTLPQNQRSVDEPTAR